MKQCFRIGAVTIAVESAHTLTCGGLFRAFSVGETDDADLTYRVGYVDRLSSSDDGAAYRFYPDSRTGLPFACTVQEGGTVEIRILASYAPWGGSVEQLFPLQNVLYPSKRRGQRDPERGAAGGVLVRSGGRAAGRGDADHAADRRRADAAAGF